MKEIQLTQGKIALVDDNDFDWLNQYSWYANINKKKWYAKSGFMLNGTTKNIKMHRFILGISDPTIKIDHRDRNGLNNQRENLRIATNSQNCANKSKKENCSSVYTGVSWDKRKGKWVAQIRQDMKRKHLGYFDKEKSAAVAYNKAAIRVHKEFANINKV